jgi:serine/threonine protein phosphatase 1
MKKTYVIADLHGRLDLLLTAIELIENDASDGGRLIVLGDFVDRGPESKGVIERLMAGPTDPKWEWTILQGNHEQIMLMGLLMPKEYLNWWVQNGGGQTLKAYGYQEKETLHPLKVPEEHLQWLVNLPAYVEDAHRIYVHAGVPSTIAVTEAKVETMQWMIWGKLDLTGETPGPMVDEPHLSGKHIVHGHEQKASHPLVLPHRTNLDSYAWKTGRLAIGVFDDAQGGGPAYVLYALDEPV